MGCKISGNISKSEEETHKKLQRKKHFYYHTKTLFKTMNEKISNSDGSILNKHTIKKCKKYKHQILMKKIKKVRSEELLTTKNTVDNIRLFGSLSYESDLDETEPQFLNHKKETTNEIHIINRVEFTPIRIIIFDINKNLFNFLVSNETYFPILPKQIKKILIIIGNHCLTITKLLTNRVIIFRNNLTCISCNQQFIYKLLN